MQALIHFVKIVLLADAVLIAFLALNFIRIIAFVDRRLPPSATGYFLIAFYIVLVAITVWLYLVWGRLQELGEPGRLKSVFVVLFAYLVFPTTLILGVIDVLSMLGIDISENPRPFNMFAAIPIWGVSLLALALTIVSVVRGTRSGPG